MALWAAKIYIPGFLLAEGYGALFAGALVLAALNTVLKPLLRLLTFPLVWITFGLFNIVIYAFLLWIADLLLTQLTIETPIALLFSSILIGLANSFF